MSRFLLGFAFLMVLLVGRGAVAGTAPLEEALADKVMGDANAPVTVIEYASLTCPHCAAFHRDTLPRLKKDYIDTGKVRLVYRDFPLDGLALAAAMLARCGGEKRYFGFIEVLYRGQVQWSRSADPRGELVRVARFGGLSEADFEACLANDALRKGIQRRAAEAQAEHDIQSTPTFIVEGKKVMGAMRFDEFKDALDRALESKR